MNEVLIANWNRVVSPTDTVYHVGDFSFGKVEMAAAIRRRLNGHIVLILGNHDRNAKVMKNVVGMDEVYEKRVIEHAGAKLYLSHYPDFSRHAQYHLYGHVHDQTPKEQPRWARNVSVEVIGYTPIPLDTIVREFQESIRAL